MGNINKYVWMLMNCRLTRDYETSDKIEKFRYDKERSPYDLRVYKWFYNRSGNTDERE